MVTFSNIPYAEAKEKGARNTRLVNKLIADGLESKIVDKKFIEEWFK